MPNLTQQQLRKFVWTQLGVEVLVSDCGCIFFLTLLLMVPMRQWLWCKCTVQTPPHQQATHRSSGPKFILFLTNILHTWTIPMPAIRFRRIRTAWLVNPSVSLPHNMLRLLQKHPSVVGVTDVLSFHVWCQGATGSKDTKDREPTKK